MRMRRAALVLMLMFASVFYFAPQPEAKAIDPVTIAILTPLAIKGAQILAPYVLRALGHFATQLVKVGANLLEFLRLPWGLLQCTLLAPWCFGSGLANMAIGCLAPLKMTWNVLLLPLSLFGVGS